jgi:hypothetical protein
MPILEKNEDDSGVTRVTSGAPEKTIKTKTIILPDGSYGTETIVVDDNKH